MGRCANCRYARLSRYSGYLGLWVCLHPYRGELNNQGKWSYPKIDNPNVTICTVDPAADSKVALQAAQTPRWCYVDTVERAAIEEPSFSPQKQRDLLDWTTVPGADEWRRTPCDP